MRIERRKFLGVGGVLGLTGCGALPRLPAVPDALAPKVEIPGIPGARFYADENDEGMLRWLREQAQQAAVKRARGGREETAEILVLSGGGEDGAFGAGLLTEWTRKGTRPEFRIVTGVSTGALTAPFAFLGSHRDSQLQEVYTTTDISRVLAWREITSALFDDAVGDSRPLAATIARYVDEQMLSEIAGAYRAGRALLIGTTDLDARRPVVWNIGAIAQSGSPNALDLVRRVLLASASIPGVFPPVMFDVQAGQERFQEMHVDGGAVSQLFLFPERIAVTQRSRQRGYAPTRIWLIRNGRLRAPRATTERRTFSVLASAVATMTQSSGNYDVTRIWLRSKAAGIPFNVSFVSEDFILPYERPFDLPYMRALFEYGQARMRSESAWLTAPPSEI
jgi:hypothetical protein